MQTPDKPSTTTRATCRCGYDRTHPRVHPNPTYGFWAWVWLLNGATGQPKRITYKCGRCGEVVEVTRDPEILRAFR